MLSRALKLSTLFILTMNIWAACCCVSSGCESAITNCADKIELANQSSCHGNDDLTEIVESNYRTGAPRVNKACECGNHLRAETNFFVVPTLKEISVTAPLICQYSQWVEPIYTREQVQPRGVFSAFLVSDRFAPRLSVLARLLI